MKVVYIETSALLSWLFNEPGCEEVRTAMASADKCVSSVLTLVEARRAFQRVLHEQLLTQADYHVLQGMVSSARRAWYFLEVTQAVINRAGDVFPIEPVRSLDALHLASALELQVVYNTLSVLSYDSRIKANLIPLGLKTWSISQ